MPRPFAEVVGSDGELRVEKLWMPTPKNALIRASSATNKLRVGGTGSSKSSDALMEVIQNYLLRWDGCHALFLRRNLTELKKSSILDIQEFVPREMFEWNATDHVATFPSTGGKLFFGHCIAEGSLITTARGLVPIEHVQPGDMVLTRNGYKHVRLAGCTGHEECVELDGLWLTLKHQVFCDGEFVMVSDILGSCEPLIQLCIHKPSYSKVLSIVATQTLHAAQSASTTRDGATRSRLDSISQYGKRLMDQYRKATRSITRTATQTITTSATWSHCPEDSTEDSTSWDSGVLTRGPAGLLTGAHQRLKSDASSAAEVIRASSSPADIVQRSVATPTGNERRVLRVYDLAVNDTPEFFANGILVHNCANLSEADLSQYLSAAFPVIVVDECGQFSGDAWQFLQSRNRVNRECKPNELGLFPKPVMLGCTNPVGPFWGFYKDTFVKKKPWNIDADAKKAKDGSYWLLEGNKPALCVYNPKDYDYIHSTVLDNPHLMARDPDLMRKLAALPKDKRDKFLYGEMDAISGQYYDCWEPGVHVLTQAQIADSVVWQPWQPRWLGWDWGRAHWNGAFWMTLALVKAPNGEFKQKVVVYREYVDKGKDYKALANTISQFTRMGLPCTSEEIRNQSRTLDAIYFSHEKFALQMDRQSPAMLMSGYLTELGLPAAGRGTRDRVGRANLLYDCLKTCGLVVLDSCPEVIDAIPQLVRDDKNIEDVLKLETKADDVYDGMSMGLFGQLGHQDTPDEEKLRQRLQKIEDPLWRSMTQIKESLDRDKKLEVDERPAWMR